jgi:hypothetical protein
MIKNRNIAVDAAIDPSKVLGHGVGEVFYVCLATSAADILVHQALEKRVASDHLFTDIQTALDACTANRNDYVLVMPHAGTITLTAALTMSKKNVHLIAPGGLGRKNGANNSTRIQAASACYAINISAASCEVAGFYIKNYSALSSIYLGDSSSAVAPHIHHNTFFMTVATGSNAPAITSSATGDGGWSGCIEDNFFMTYGAAGSPTMTAVISLSGAAGMVQINRNVIIPLCAVTSAISAPGVGGQICDNYILQPDAYAGSNTGTIETAITAGTASMVFRNMLGVENDDDVAGLGTYSGQQNYSHSAGGALAA